MAEWYDIPRGIKGINYDKLERAKIAYLKIENFYKTIDIIVDDYKQIANGTTQFCRIVPPYMRKCDGATDCDKGASYLNVRTSKYLCWFHKRTIK